MSVLRILNQFHYYNTGNGRDFRQRAEPGNSGRGSALYVDNDVSIQQAHWIIPALDFQLERVIGERVFGSL